jgi:hypothetical protein
MTLIAILLAATVLMSGGLLWVLRGRSAEEPYHTCRCPGCAQKVRYRASRAGCAALCPRCRQSLPLPASPRESAASGTAVAAPPRVGQVLRRQVQLSIAPR